MPNEAVLEQVEFGELIQSVDDGRAAGEPFKLPAASRTLLNNRLADLKAKDSATLLTEGGRATASANVRAAVDQLNKLLRDGYNFVNGIASFQITDADRLGVFTAYGWEQGEIGNITDARTESLANQAIAATPSITNPAYRYPAALLTLITDQLAIVNANQPLATGGTAQAATAARDEALVLLQTAVDRVRFFYCSASDDEDQTPELAKIGKQPRRDAGGAAPQPLPAAPGTATFDATALTLTVAALPDHATTLRAYRKPAGGTAQLAGTSTTNVVSVIAAGPLTPGVIYELWLVGHNSAGDGPESNHVTHVAT
jgi:hypothetical protein